MQDMVEPDRTIVIVSLIGLVVIWGSVLYHKVVQGGGAEAHDTEAESIPQPEETASSAEAAKPKKKSNRKRK